MTRKEIIDGLKMTMDLILFDPSTGEDIDPDDLNDINRTTYDACKCAVELLESQDVTLHMNLPEISAEEAVEILKRNNRIELLPPAQPETHEKRTETHECDCIERQAAIDRINKQREHLRPDIYPQDKIGDAAYRICAEFIERLPSAQPEIVLCKDCKHCEMTDDNYNYCESWKRRTYKGWYCVNAKKRDS